MSYMKNNYIIVLGSIQMCLWNYIKKISSLVYCVCHIRAKVFFFLSTDTVTFKKKIHKRNIFLFSVDKRKEVAWYRWKTSFIIKQSVCCATESKQLDDKPERDTGKEDKVRGTYTDNSWKYLKVLRKLWRFVSVCQNERAEVLRK